MRRGFGFLAAFLVPAALVLSACGGQKPAQPPAVQPPATQQPVAPAQPAGGGEPIKVAVVTSLTGNLAATGKQVALGVKAAAKAWNDKGGIKGRKIEVTVEDDQSTPNGAVAAYNKVIAQKPVAVWAPTFTPLVMAMGEAIKANKTPTLTSASAPIVTKSGLQYVFRLRTNDDEAGVILADYVINELKPKKPAMIYANNDYGKGGYEILKRELEKAGIKFVAAEQFNQGDKDVSAQLLKIKQANPDFLLAYAVPADAGLISAQSAQVGLTARIVGSPGFATPEYLSLAKEAAEGTVVLIDSMAGLDAASKDWADKVRALEPGTPVAFVVSTNYDGAMMVFDVLSKQEIKDGTALRDALLKVKDYPGVSGKFSFDADGNGLHQGIIAKWEKGKLVELKKMAR